MVKDGFLDKKGETRASVYFIKGTRPGHPFTHDLFANSPDLAVNSPDLTAVLLDLLAEWGMEQMPSKLSSDKMKELISSLCTNRWLSLAELSIVLKRETKTLQDQYLTPMIADGSLQLKFPQTKNHPAQAYKIGI